MPSTTADDHLSLQNELLRKAVATISDAHAEWERGERTGESMKATFEAVYSTVSGLVEWGDLDGIYDDFKALGLENANPARVLHKADGLIVITSAKDAMAVYKIKTDGVVGPHQTQRRNLKWMEDLAVSLRAKGWKELT